MGELCYAKSALSGTFCYGKNTANYAIWDVSKCFALFHQTHQITNKINSATTISLTHQNGRLECRGIGVLSLRRRKAHFCLPEEAPSLTRRPRTATYKNALSRARFKRSTPKGAQKIIRSNKIFLLCLFS